ncbi:PolC-type DNA polymerase III [Indiicoccus explosivorum]|uniref:3'-5' exonuclease n=1 Tax=Indiicoccus explosivorum TaxID=1917864 RepID=UPI000B42F0E9|nr:3'-5' exonuclease [Indiicoccus explosivorum]
MKRQAAGYWLKQKRKTQPTARRNPSRRNYTMSMEISPDYVVLDFETTGLRAGEDKIIQIGAVKYIGHVRTETLYLLVDPEQPISRTITRITGIRDEDVADAPVIEEVAEDLIAFIGGLPIVAHNAPFDMGFLCALSSIVPVPHYTVIDTVRLAKRVMRNVPNHKLTTLSAFLELEHDAHDALGDCLVTAHVYQYCAAQL